MANQLTVASLQDAQEEIQAFIRNQCPEEGAVEFFPGIVAIRKESAGQKSHSMSISALALTVQGEKEVVIGGQVFRYDPDHFLVTTLQMPVQSCVMKASPESPYLAILFELDPKLISTVILESGLGSTHSREGVNSMGVSRMTPGVLETVARITRLVRDTEDAEFLLPLAKKELIYRLLQSGQGPALHQIATNSGAVNRVTRAIDLLKSEFNRQLRMEDIAREVGMSISGFHQHFKNVTGMSPLQFQKEIRLREARRLMLGENMDAASAGYEVGYDDPSHFSREYKKLFGAPPLRDIQQIRAQGELTFPA